jgi:hypothetical protein
MSKRDDEERAAIEQAATTVAAEIKAFLGIDLRPNSLINELPMVPDTAATYTVKPLKTPLPG